MFDSPHMLRGKRKVATVAAASGEAMPEIETIADQRPAHVGEFRARLVTAWLGAGAPAPEMAEGFR